VLDHGDTRGLSHLTNQCLSSSRNHQINILILFK